MMKEWFGCLSLSDTFLSQFFGFFLSEFDLWGVNAPHFVSFVFSVLFFFRFIFEYFVSFLLCF